MRTRIINRPTLYLSNFASKRSPGKHGPGPVYTLMCRPRHFEHGEGSVPILMHDVETFDAAKYDTLPYEELRWRLEHRLMQKSGELRPGKLYAMQRPKEQTAAVPGAKGARLRGWNPVIVPDGATLCCGCAAADDCHRRWVVPYLQRAGWSIVMDGVPLNDDGPLPVLSYAIAMLRADGDIDPDSLATDLRGLAGLGADELSSEIDKLSDQADDDENAESDLHFYRMCLSAVGEAVRAAQHGDLDGALLALEELGTDWLSVFRTWADRFTLEDNGPARGAPQIATVRQYKPGRWRLLGFCETAGGDRDPTDEATVRASAAVFRAWLKGGHSAAVEVVLATPAHIDLEWMVETLLTWDRLGGDRFLLNHKYALGTLAAREAEALLADLNPQRPGAQP